jgi:hypothetical protein
MLLNESFVCPTGRSKFILLGNVRLRGGPQSHLAHGLRFDGSGSVCRCGVRNEHFAPTINGAYFFIDMRTIRNPLAGEQQSPLEDFRGKSFALNVSFSWHSILSSPHLTITAPHA